MKETYRIIASCMLAAMFSAAFQDSAQAREPRNIAYAYGHTLELQAGWAASPYAVNGARGLNFGGTWDIRYSYFMSRHWGAYAQIGTSTTNASYDSFFKSLDRADGGKYKYSTGDYYYRAQLPSCTYAPLFTAGAVFRYDFGGWSLRPRAGLGVAQCFIGTTDYVRYPRVDGGAPEYFNVRPATYVKEYLADSHPENKNIVSFVGSACLQLTYSVGSHFFFSVEAGADIMPQKVEFTHRRYSAKSAYNPKTWSEAISQSELKGCYAKDEGNFTESTSSHIVGGHAYAKVGFGWNIGWNRNERNR